MRMPSIKDFNNAVAAIEQVVHSGPNPPITDDNGKRLLTGGQLGKLEEIVSALFEPVFDSFDEGVPVELDGQATMLRMTDLGGLARGTLIRIGLTTFKKRDAVWWEWGYDDNLMNTTEANYVFNRMAVADTRPEVTTFC